MLRGLWCLVVVLVQSGARVVHQEDGIVSIITELEPEPIPVTYLQAVDRPNGRARSIVNQEEIQPLQEGEFRVRSEKIRVVDPETGFKVVHEVSDPEVEEREREPEKNERQHRRSGQRKQFSEKEKVIYPSISQGRLSRYPSSYEEGNNEELSEKGNVRQRIQRQKKQENYGVPYPKRDNTVRTEKTTKVRNNDEPIKVYKQTIVRPVSEEDEISLGRKKGKYGRYRSYKPAVNIDDGITIPGRIGEYPSQKQRPLILITPDHERGIPSQGDSDRRKSSKEYSSRTVVKFPDGYAHGNEKRVQSSSKYKTGSIKNSNNRAPFENTDQLRKYDGGIPVKKLPLNDRVELDQPLQEESTYISSDIEEEIPDGLVVNDGATYSGGDYDRGYGGHNEDFDKEKHFGKEKGKEYVAAHKSAHGGKSEKGYNNEEAYAKGNSEKHGQGEDKGYSTDKDGEKKSHLDKASQFSEGHKSSEGAKGSDYQKEKGHKKGHKKSGFRTVHHKDEFKKKEEFYDEEHDSGNEQKHGHQAQEHHDNSGGHDKKEHLDSGYHQANRGHKGGHEKGHGFNQEKGFNKGNGNTGHYNSEQEYGKKSGFKEGETHGHSEYGGHRGHGYH